MSQASEERPLVVHVMYRFDIGGLENGVVNLVNGMTEYRHAIVALTDITDFRQRIRRDDVQFVAMNKPPGHGAKVYPRLFRLFRESNPAIVHTRNLAALEATVPSWAAGVPVRIHGEHGWDIYDPDGSSSKYRWMRWVYRPFVSHYIAVSRDLERYLTARVGVPVNRVTQVYNGVDTERFHSAPRREPIPGCPFVDPALWLVGTVGRMQEVKDQLTLVRAFIRALEIDPSQRARLRLVMVGEGPLRPRAQSLLTRAGMSECAWLPGERNDVPVVLRGLDCFALPSLGEGISNTILEAMASGLPVIATDVGGNADLVTAGRTGQLVPSADPEALAQRILDYARNPEGALAAGRAGRARAERQFSLATMVQSYRQLYARLLRDNAGRAGRAAARQQPPLSG